MKKLKLIILLLIMLPLSVFASGSLKISNTIFTIEEGSTSKVTLTSDNLVGYIDISSNNTELVTVDKSKIWLENEGSNMKDTLIITAVKPGTTKVKLNVQMATMDPGHEEDYIKTVYIDVTVIKKKSSDSLIKELRINDEKITSFDSSQTSFNLGATDDESIKVEGITNDSNATITGNGIAKLNYGQNKITLKVTAENNSTRTYTIYVTRNDHRDNDSSLKSINISSGKIDFKPNILKYNIQLDEKVEEFIVKGTLNSEKQRIGYTPSNKITLKAGETKTITIKVLAENESYTCYKTTVTRGKKITPTNDDPSKIKEVSLKDLYIPNYVINFDKDIQNYSINVPNNINSLDISYDTNYPEDDVEITGNSSLAEGDNIINVKVSNELGEKVYKIKVVKEGIVENKIVDNTKYYIIIICLLIIIIIILLGIIYVKTDVFKKKTLG